MGYAETVQQGALWRHQLARRFAAFCARLLSREAAMEDHWTLPLSEEGTKELLREREERPAESEQRLRLLERVREAVRSRQRGGAQSILSER